MREQVDLDGGVLCRRGHRKKPERSEESEHRFERARGRWGSDTEEQQFAPRINAVSCKGKPPDPRLRDGRLQFFGRGGWRIPDFMRCCAHPE